MPGHLEELPHFVRKQVEKASKRLFSSLNQLNLVLEIHGSRVLILELKPHPTKSLSLRSPWALLDYQSSGWSLLFRGSQGAWQKVPGDVATRTLDETIDVMVADDYRVFWRQ